MSMVGKRINDKYYREIDGKKLSNVDCAIVIQLIVFVFLPFYLN